MQKKQSIGGAFFCSDQSINQSIKLNNFQMEKNEQYLFNLVCEKNIPINFFLFENSIFNSCFF